MGQTPGEAIQAFITTELKPRTYKQVSGAGALWPSALAALVALSFAYVNVVGAA